MDGILILGGLLFVGFIGLGALFLFLQFSKRQNNTLAFQTVAKRLKGSSSSYGGTNSVFFRVDGVAFQIRGVTRDQTIVRVSTNWKNHHFRLKLFPEVYSEGLKKFLGMQDIKIGDRDFDSRFVIQSNDEMMLLEVLSPEVQHSIKGMSEINLSIVGGEIFAEKAMPLDNSSNISQFAERFVKVFQAMNSADSLQLDLRYVITDSATCMVCGDPILAAPVNCMSCQTPHHEDCWKYMGICSTYGCGQGSFHRSAQKSSSAIVIKQ